MNERQIWRCRLVGLFGAIVFLGLGLASWLGVTGEGNFLDLYGTAVLALLFAVIWMFAAVWPYRVDTAESPVVGT